MDPSCRRRPLISSVENFSRNSPDVRVVGQIQRHRVLHRIVDESALALELVVGEIGHLRENVGHSVAVRRPRERR